MFRSMLVREEGADHAGRRKQVLERAGDAAKGGAVKGVGEMLGIVY